jgi:competence protein ComEC
MSVRSLQLRNSPALLVGECVLHALRFRPLAAMACAFAAGIACGGTLAGTAVAASVGLLALACICWRRRHAPWAASICALLFLLGAWHGWLAARPEPNDVSRLASGGIVTLEGRVEGEAEARSGRASARVRVERVSLPDGRSRPCGGAVFARFPIQPGAAPPDHGDRVSLRGRLEPPEPARNPGGFDQAAWLARQRIFAVVTVRRADDAHIMAESGAVGLPDRLIAGARRSLRGTLEGALPPVQAAVVEGLLIGSRRGIPPALEDDFVATGTVHVLSTSGLHVAMLTLAMLWALRGIGCPQRLTGFLLIASLLFLGALAEWRPAVTRAVIAGCIYFAAELLGREPDAPTALAAAVVYLLARSPGELYSPGFQLSVVTVAAILAGSSALTAWRSRRVGWEEQLASQRTGAEWTIGRGLADAVAVSVFAQLGSAPLVACYFNQLTWTSLPANLVCIVVVYGIMVGGLALWPLAVFPPAAAFVGMLVGLLVTTLIGAVSWFAGLPGAVVSVEAPHAALVGLYYAALALAAAWAHDCWKPPASVVVHAAPVEREPVGV